MICEKNPLNVRLWLDREFNIQTNDWYDDIEYYDGDSDESQDVENIHGYDSYDDNEYDMAIVMNYRMLIMIIAYQI